MTAPKHRLERSETPWWWFGQPWARGQATQGMNDETFPAGPVPREEEPSLDSSWFKALSP